MTSWRFSILNRVSIVMGAAVVAVIGAAVDVQSQALKDVQRPDTPLVLKAQGSFIVGGIS